MLLDQQVQLDSSHNSYQQLLGAYKDKTRSLESTRTKYAALKARALAGEMQPAAVSDDGDHGFRASAAHNFPEHMSRSHSRALGAMDRWSGAQGVIPGMSKAPSTPMRPMQRDRLRHGTAMGPPAQPSRGRSKSLEWILSKLNYA